MIAFCYDLFIVPYNSVALHYSCIFMCVPCCHLVYSAAHSPVSLFFFHSLCLYLILLSIHCLTYHLYYACTFAHACFGGQKKKRKRTSYGSQLSASSEKRGHAGTDRQTALACHQCCHPPTGEQACSGFSTSLSSLHASSLLLLGGVSISLGK